MALTQPDLYVPFNLSEVPMEVKVVLNANKSIVIGWQSHFYEESLIYHSSKVL